MKPAVLYVSYDGMLEPLGESQVLRYLEQLTSDYSINLVSFEKERDLADSERLRELRSRLSGCGINWSPLRYHKRPAIVSTIWDMIVGAFTCLLIARKTDIGIFHSRNILCAAMLYPAAAFSRGKFLVDIRGFWADERVDGGIIAKDGLVHRALKWLERKMLGSADCIVTLTHASVPYLQNDARFGHPRAPIVVIPTCADLTRFVPGDAPTKDDVITMGYVGQMGTWYLLEETLRLFRSLKSFSPSARLLIVNQHEHREIRLALEQLGLASNDVKIVAASHKEVPALIRQMTFGTSFILPAFSKISSCPTKLAEYLGCGVPCLANPGVGDVAEILTEHRVGVVLNDFADASLDVAVRQMVELAADPTLPGRCRRVAEDHFALDSGVAKYREIYRSLIHPPSRSGRGVGA